MEWMIDASFDVQTDLKSYTGATLNMGGNQMGVLQVISWKQKLNIRSGTEAEVVAVDDVMVMVPWAQMFLEQQGEPVERNIVYQDNQNAILLEMNGRRSSVQWSMQKWNCSWSNTLLISNRQGWWRRTPVNQWNDWLWK